MSPERQGRNEGAADLASRRLGAGNHGRSTPCPSPADAGPRRRSKKHRPTVASWVGESPPRNQLTRMKEAQLSRAEGLLSVCLKPLIKLGELFECKRGGVKLAFPRTAAGGRGATGPIMGHYRTCLGFIERYQDARRPRIGIGRERSILSRSTTPKTPTMPASP